MLGRRRVGASTKAIEELRNEVDCCHVRVEFGGQNECRRTRSRTEIDHSEPVFLRQTRSLDRFEGCLSASGSLSVVVAVKVDEKSDQIVIRRGLPPQVRRYGSATSIGSGAIVRWSTEPV